MNTRLKRLLGYQLIKKANIGNELMYHHSQILQDINPVTGDPLLIGGEEATIEDIKGLTTVNNNIIDNECQVRLKGFLANYPTQADIEDGLDIFSVTLSNLNKDANDIDGDNTHIKVELPSQASFVALAALGIQYEHRNEKVDVIVNPSLVSVEEKSTNTFHDLLNAIEFNLRGLSSYTGNTKYTTVEAIKTRVTQRIGTGYRAMNSLPSNSETTALINAMYAVESDLSSAQTLGELINLADDLNAEVEQLPLIRRWWNYGN